MKTTMTEQNSFKWLFFILNVSEPYPSVSGPEEYNSFSSSLCLLLSLLPSLPHPLSVSSLGFLLPCQEVSINPTDWASPLGPFICTNKAQLLLPFNANTKNTLRPRHQRAPPDHEYGLMSIADDLCVATSGH